MEIGEEIVDYSERVDFPSPVRGSAIISGVKKVQDTVGSPYVELFEKINDKGTVVGFSSKFQELCAGILSDSGREPLQINPEDQYNGVVLGTHSLFVPGIIFSSGFTQKHVNDAVHDYVVRLRMALGIS